MRPDAAVTFVAVSLLAVSVIFASCAARASVDPSAPTRLPEFSDFDPTTQAALKTAVSNPRCVLAEVTREAIRLATRFPTELAKTRDPAATLVASPTTIVKTPEAEASAAIATFLAGC